MTINVYARPQKRPWLFDDLKLHFASADTEGRRVVVTDEPVEADAWVCIRTRELSSSPNPAKTLVQIHDLYPEDYGEGGQRHLVKEAGAICYTNLKQPKILQRAGLNVKGKPHLLRPIGPMRQFTCRQNYTEEFTVGVVGRATKYRGTDIKRFDAACDAILANRPLRVVMVGEGLAPYVHRLRSRLVEVEWHERESTPIESYPELYHKMDCLVTYSLMEAGPMCLFEALASGVWVISSRTGWASEVLEGAMELGRVVDTLSELSDEIDNAKKERLYQFETREEAVEEFKTHWPFHLEDWVEDNLTLAEQLANA